MEMVNAFIHSKKEKTDKTEVVKIITKLADNDYMVLLRNGIYCHAIYNFFANSYYADDIYGVISSERAQLLK